MNVLESLIPRIPLHDESVLKTRQSGCESVDPGVFDFDETPALLASVRAYGRGGNGPGLLMRYRLSAALDRKLTCLLDMGQHCKFIA